MINQASSRNNAPLLPPLRPVAKPDGLGSPAWPTFVGKSQVVGTSARGVTVYVDQALGAAALQNAEDLLAGADAVVSQNNALFGITGGSVAVVVMALNGRTDGTGGADHNGCDFTSGNAIEVDASYGRPDRVIALFEAELSECAMNGRLCGLSTGEALSRWCASAVSANALADFATAPQWAQDGMPDWVNQTARTDQDATSTGCGMAFISWLLSIGSTLGGIAQTMVTLGEAGSLATLYARLTGNAADKAWPAFHAAVEALPQGILNDDPFGPASPGVLSH